jgi:hypothetical protein
MPEAVDFYAALGARVLNGSRDGDFTLLQLNVSELSLLAHPPNPAQDDPTWAKLVRTLVDRGERLADVVGQGVFGGEGVATGVDLDGAVAA